MKTILLWLALVFVSGNIFSQEHQTDTEKNLFTSNNWSEKRINSQITWFKLNTGELFGEPQSINVLKIDLKKDRYGVTMVYSDSVRVLLSEMAEHQKALVAINGTFFDMKNGGAVVFLKVDDKIITPPNPKASGFMRESAIIIGDSVAIIENPKDDWIRFQEKFDDIMVSGPLLIKDGNLTEPDSISFNLSKHPRSAIGITYDYELLFVTADGRNEDNALGLTIHELALLMQALNCREAMNLDGGGSTTLWLKGKGVINYPSDNKVFDHEGARKIANGIVIVKN